MHGAERQNTMTDLLKEFVERNIENNEGFAEHRTKYLVDDVQMMVNRVEAGQFKLAAESIPSLISNLSQLQNILAATGAQAEIQRAMESIKK